MGEPEGGLVFLGFGIGGGYVLLERLMLIPLAVFPTKVVSQRRFMPE